MQVLVAEIKLINFGAIVTRCLAGSHNGIHKYREKSRNQIGNLETQRKKQSRITETPAIIDKEDEKMMRYFTLPCKDYPSLKLPCYLKSQLEVRE